VKDCSQCPYWQYVRSWAGTPLRRSWCVRGRGADCVTFAIKCAEVCFKREGLHSIYKSSNFHQLRQDPLKYLHDLADKWKGELKLPPYEPKCGDICLRELGTKFDVWTAFKIGCQYAYISATGFTMSPRFKTDVVISLGGLKCRS